VEVVVVVVEVVVVVVEVVEVVVVVVEVVWCLESAKPIAIAAITITTTITIAVALEIASFFSTFSCQFTDILVKYHINLFATTKYNIL